VAIPAAASISALDLTPEPMATSEFGVAKILRLIANFSLGAVSNSANPQHIAVGVYVVSHEAFLQLAFSTPFAGDPSQSWYYWKNVVMVSAAGSAELVTWEADIRTQRLLRGGYKLVFIVENPVNSFAMTLEVSFRNLWEID